MRPGNVIQITDLGHAWLSCLLIVDEVRDWGVIAYCPVPQSNDGSQPVGLAFNRLEVGTYERVGQARILEGGVRNETATDD